MSLALIITLTLLPAQNGVDPWTGVDPVQYDQCPLPYALHLSSAPTSNPTPNPSLNRDPDLDPITLPSISSRILDKGISGLRAPETWEPRHNLYMADTNIALTNPHHDTTTQNRLGLGPGSGFHLTLNVIQEADMVTSTRATSTQCMSRS